MVYQRKPFGPVHGPDLLRKKSRSTVNWPIFSYKGASNASSAVTPFAAPALLRANNEAVPSSKVFFQAWIWLACTPNRLDSSATVPSSRTAANATFALNSALCFFRVLVMSHLGRLAAPKGDPLLATCPVSGDHLSYQGPTLQAGNIGCVRRGAAEESRGRPTRHV